MDAQPVGNAYVRLLDRTGEFTAEVPTVGDRPLPVLRGTGEWTLRTLAPKADWWTSRSPPRWARWPRSPSRSELSRHRPEAGLYESPATGCSGRAGARRVSLAPHLIEGSSTATYMAHDRTTVRAKQAVQPMRSRNTGDVVNACATSAVSSRMGCCSR